MTRTLLALALLTGCGGGSDDSASGGNPGECGAYCYVAYCGGEDYCEATCSDAPAAQYESVACYEWLQLNLAPATVIACACMSEEVRGQHPAECGQTIEQYGSERNLRAMCLDE